MCPLKLRIYDENGQTYNLALFFLPKNDESECSKNTFLFLFSTPRRMKEGSASSAYQNRNIVLHRNRIKFKIRSSKQVWEHLLSAFQFYSEFVCVLGQMQGIVSLP